MIFPYFLTVPPKGDGLGCGFGAGFEGLGLILMIYILSGNYRLYDKFHIDCNNKGNL
jgi:hypothetical protein